MFNYVIYLQTKEILKQRNKYKLNLIDNFHYRLDFDLGKKN